MSFRRRINIFNKNYSRSIYLNYLDGHRPCESQDSLNSSSNIYTLQEIKAELESINNNLAVDERFDFATFEYRNESTGLKVLHKLNILTSINDQDIQAWTLSFKELFRVCNWNTEAQIEVLRQIVHISIQYIIGPPQNPENYLNLILSKKYNSENSYKYYEKLNGLHQRDFYTIRKYLHEIEICSQKLGVCMGWDEKLIAQKIQEAVFNSLENTTKLELSRFFKKDFHHIYNSILTTELMLIEMMQKNTNNSYANYKPDNKNRKEYKTHSNRYSR
ncbi:hypothetical protein DMUE_0956 [Dictyocoela muelleri]|nr:hypothetical protein DMUE_0956 [Dictyocoela muelleri]